MKVTYDKRRNFPTTHLHICTLEKIKNKQKYKNKIWDQYCGARPPTCDPRLISIQSLDRSTCDDGPNATVTDESFFDIHEHVKYLKSEFGKNFSYYEQMLEDVIFLLRSIYINRNLKDYKMRVFESVLIFARLRTGKSLFHLTLDTLDKCGVLGELIVDLLESLLEKADFKIQNFDVFSNSVDSVYDMLSKFTALQNTLLFKKVHSLLRYFIAFGFCEKLGVQFSDIGFTRMEANYCKQTLNAGTNFLLTLADTILYVLKKGLLVIKTGDINCIYHSGDTYGSMYDAYYKLKKQRPQLINSQLFGFTDSSYLNLLDETIEKFTNVKKHATNLSNYDKESVNRCLGDLEMWRTDQITKKSCREMRKAPFSVLLFGESGIGKSYLKEMLFNFYGGVMKFETTSDFCFTRSPGANYWDGYKSSMWCVVLDDIGFPHPDKCPTGDDTFKDLIQIQNNQPFGPDQAALEDKGKTPMKARLLIGTTNIKNLNASYYYSHASAAQRRLPIVITPTVLPQFAKEDGMLDKTKLTSSKIGEYDDYWSFDVDEVQAVLTTSNNKNANYKRVLTKCTLHELLIYLERQIVAHEENQTKFISAVKDMCHVTLCDNCHMPKDQFCNCGKEELAVVTTTSNGGKYSIVDGKFKYMMADGWLQRALKILEPEKPKYDDEIRKIFLEDEFEIQGSVEIHLTCIFYITLLCGMLYAIFSMNFNRFYQDALLLRRTMYFPRKFFGLIDRCKRHMGWYNRFDRQYWINLGVRQQRQLLGSQAYQFVAVSVSAIGTVYGLYKTFLYFTRKTTTVQSGLDIDSIGKKPTVIDGEKPNIWVNNDITLSTFDLTPQITSNNADELAAFNSRIVKNCVDISVSLPRIDGVRKGKAVCLRGNLYITNNHNIPEICDDTVMTFIQCKVGPGVNGNIKFRLSEADIQRIPECDICVITVSGVPPKKGIYDLIPRRNVNTCAEGFYLSRATDGVESIRPVKCVTLLKDFPIVSPEKEMKIQIDLWKAAIKGDTSDGDCGALMVIDTPRGKMVGGLHIISFNDSPYVAAIALYKDMFENIIKNKSMYAVQCNEPEISAPSAPKELKPLHAKANVRYLAQGSINVYGSFPERREAKSRVGISPLAKYLENHGYEIKYGKPEMKSWHPYHLALADLTKPLQMFNSDILNDVTEAFKADLMLGFDDSIKHVHVLDLFTAVNGAPGVQYIDKLNRSTSAGSPWSTSKRRLMRLLPPQHGLQEPVEIHDEVKVRCQKIINDYIGGKQSNCVFMAHLKDEAVSLEKVKLKKTRLFCGAPMDLTIVTRMFLLTSIRFVQNNKFLFESAPGIIAQSSDWEDLYKYVTQFGKDRIIAGDYRKFDKTMPAKFILKAFDILKFVCQSSGNYSADDLSVIDGIAVDTAYAMTDVNGDLLQFFGGNPSGHALTVIINGLVNSLYMRYAYYKLNPEKRVDDFKDNVSLITYGDDNLMGVREGVDWYNHTTISELFAEYGLGYTMADKDAQSVPYICIDDATFLKRSFREDPTTGFYFAPLEHESIEKSLMVWTYSRSITSGFQAEAIVTSAIQEYFFYGKEIFEEKRVLLQTILVECGYAEYIRDRTFPTWDECVERFIQASKGKTL